MTENDKIAIKELSEILRSIKNGVFEPDRLKDSKYSDEMTELIQSVDELSDSLHSSLDYIYSLSEGNLDANPPKHNLLLSPFKNLQSNLRHLTWQVQQIAQGDYNQNVAFMGDFSKAFNYLIEQLRDRHKLEVQLSESEEVFRLLFERTDDGIFLIKDGVFIDCNQKAVEMLGYDSKNDVVGKSPDSISKNNYSEENHQKFLQFAQIALEDGNALFECNFRKHDGSVLQVEVSLTAIPHNGEKYLYTSWRDISQRKEAERKLIESEKNLRQSNSAKDKFFSIVAHDLKNPFNILLNLSKKLHLQYEELDSEEKASTIQDIFESSESTFRLLENLLEWSRTQRNKIQFKSEEIDIYELAYNSLYLFNQSAKAKNINLVNLVETDSIVWADRHMLNTIFRNLVSNALKFTPEWGNVIISAERNDDSFKIYVNDSGVGISPIDIENIFNIDKSFTTLGTNSEKGTGLGLIICKEFIEKHNLTPTSGKIFVESALGDGSSFSFTLPAMDYINKNIEI